MSGIDGVVEVDVAGLSWLIEDAAMGWVAVDPADQHRIDSDTPSS